MSRVAPDFVVIGPQEAGTGALGRLLKPRAGATGLVGVIAPKLTRGWHGTTTATIAARTARAFPDAKLIALLRDPIERARSQHRTASSLGRETRSFDQAARESLSADGLAVGRFLPDEINTYIAQSEYGRILGEYLRYFPADALHVELTSDLEREPLEVTGRLLEFVGIADDRAGRLGGGASVVRDPRGVADPPIADDVREMLTKHFAADALLLHAILGHEVPWRLAGGEPPHRRIAVYTAITGGKDTLERPERAYDGCDYICFTDNPYLRSEAWQLRPIELGEDDPGRRALRAKVLAHRYLPEYASSVWVDANLSLRGDPAALFDRLAPTAGVIACHRDPTTDTMRETCWTEVEHRSQFDELKFATALRGGPCPSEHSRRENARAIGSRRPHAAELRAASIRREIERATTVLLSFPKAGRSWICYFLARYLAEGTGSPLDLDLLAGGREIPPMAILHEHVDVFEDAPAPARLVHPGLLMKRRIIVLVRDPRDSLVSYWHQKRIRERRPVPERLELFADCPVYGIERISQGTALLLDFYDRHPGAKLLVSYEDLVREPKTHLRQILRFTLDGRPPNKRACREALAASSFERMRQWESGLTPEERSRYDNRFGARQYATEDAYFKVRRGEVGTFAAEFSRELQRHVEQLPHTASLLERLAAREPPLRPASGAGRSVAQRA